MIGVAEVSGVEDVDIPLVDDLCGVRGTLFAGLEKKLSQFSAWSNASGKKMRLGLSGAVDLMCTPLSLTFLESTRSGSGWGREYCRGCAGLSRSNRRWRAARAFALLLNNYLYQLTHTIPYRNKME